MYNILERSGFIALNIAPRSDPNRIIQNAENMMRETKGREK